ncbi:hypothetical protein [Pseudosulfitobacter sp. SM2401]|uniref:hypothetical protein n=1 Tax=Pseudosulfitobacter sp. SM2401 TaxID=3350098 RepID=UPI0036F2A287
MNKTVPRSAPTRNPEGRPFACNAAEEVEAAFEISKYDTKFPAGTDCLKKAYGDKQAVLDALHFTTNTTGKRSIALRGRLQGLTALLALSSLDVKRPTKLAKLIVDEARPTVSADTLKATIQTVTILVDPGTRIHGKSVFIREIAERDRAMKWALAFVAVHLVGLCEVDGATLSKEQIVARIEGCLYDQDDKDIGYEMPVDLFRALSLDLGLIRTEDQTIKVRELHYIDEQFLDYAAADHSAITERNTDVENLVVDIKSCLEKEKVGGKTRFELIILHGGQHTGKKSVVGDLLLDLQRKAHDRHDRTTSLPLLGEDGTVTQLPVFAVNVQHNNYFELAAKVLGFLKRIHDPKETRSIEEIARAQLPANPHRGAMSDLLAEIAVLHDVIPAFFIFSDVHGLEADALQRVLGDRGIYRLLDTLMYKNCASRFLVTQPDKSFDDWSQEPRIWYRWLKMDAPDLSRFYWYPSDERLDLFQKNIEPKITSFTNYNDVPVSGEILLTMSALLSVRTDTVKLTSEFQSILDAVDDEAEKENEEEFQKLQPLVVRNLVDGFFDEGILPAMALISAAAITEDGVMVQSLPKMLKLWKDHYPRSGVLPGINANAKEVHACLRRVYKGTQALYLSKGKVTQYNQEEYGLRESNTMKAREEWYMSRSLALRLMGEINQRDEGRIRRQAFRVLSIAARRRAQFRRLQDGNFGVQASFSPARDIQSFYALLASLPDKLEPIKAPDISFGNLRMLTGETFGYSIERQVEDESSNDIIHSPELSLRFVIKVLLKQDIDQSNRLSMVTDQDELRLQLFLRLFMPLSKLERVGVVALRKAEVVRGLPANIPEHLNAVLTSVERLDLLLSVALSAYHSQLNHVVAWAFGVAQKHIQEHAIEKDVAAMGKYNRIVCVRLDTAIIQPATFATEHIGKKPCLQHVMELWDKEWAWWLAALEDQYGVGVIGPFERMARGDASGIKKSKSETKDLFETVQAESKDAHILSSLPYSTIEDGMRLVARKARMLWMLTGTPGRDEATKTTYRKIYDTLQEYEHFIARFGADDETPVVFSGKSGRHAIKVLSNDEVVLVLPDQQGTSGSAANAAPLDAQKVLQIRQVLQANIARLGQFSGVERLHTLAGHALADVAEHKNPNKALDYITNACDQLNAHTISHGGQLELLAFEIGLKMIVASREDETPLDYLEAILEECKHHITVANALNMWPMKVRFLILEGRARAAIMGRPDEEYGQNSDRAVKKCFKDAMQLAKEIGFRPAEVCANCWSKMLAVKSTRSIN